MTAVCVCVSETVTVTQSCSCTDGHTAATRLVTMTPLIQVAVCDCFVVYLMAS